MASISLVDYFFINRDSSLNELVSGTVGDETPIKERQVSPEELCGPRMTGKTRTMTDDGFQMAGWQTFSRLIRDVSWQDGRPSHD
jgi:hypothetical protein